jgi:hypothetical protein
MPKAILTTTFWMEVEDADEASYVAAKADAACRLNIEAIVEQRGVDIAELEGELGFFGTNFWIIDETKVLG